MVIHPKSYSALWIWRPVLPAYPPLIILTVATLIIIPVSPMTPLTCIILGCLGGRDLPLMVLREPLLGLEPSQRLLVLDTARGYEHRLPVGGSCRAAEWPRLWSHRCAGLKYLEMPRKGPTVWEKLY